MTADSSNRVLVGMSGGIDSTATCLKLLDKGYEVIGLTMQVWGDEPHEAIELAKQLGITHYVVDERDAFKKTIIQNFIDEYRLGRTPNPCVMCNPLFKFRILAEWADKLDCAYIATGHYVRNVYMNGHTYIVAGNDMYKDQSYFLWKVSENIISRCIFPLGSCLKSEVRNYLRKRGFVEKAKSGESMEVCFINGDYRDFLKERYAEQGIEIKSGWFVNSEGVRLGDHRGIPYYTVGQRRGLELAFGKPIYVLKLNAEKNTVMLGDSEQLHTRFMLLEDAHIVNESDFFDNINLTVRIRYHSRPLHCRAKRLDDGRIFVKFHIEAASITPGQSAVFYDCFRELGGAFIASQRGIALVKEQNREWIENTN